VPVAACRRRHWHCEGEPLGEADEARPATISASAALAHTTSKMGPCLPSRNAHTTFTLCAVSPPRITGGIVVAAEFVARVPALNGVFFGSDVVQGRG